jgi:2-polyprenyl-3-methyl-5-hydroxy-6-metoxy-1,4-benzoquinol methylase
VTDLTKSLPNLHEEGRFQILTRNELQVLPSMFAAESIKSQLLLIGAIDDASTELFAEQTRDCDDLKVFRDTKSGVIFIDEHYVGDAAYVEGAYRDDELSKSASFEDYFDAQRRYQTYLRFFCGKKLCDFGCGAGLFLKLAAPTCSAVHGIELQESFIRNMQSNAICCTSQLPEDSVYDVITLFHVLEHLPDFRCKLKQLRTHLKPGGQGTIIVEVPHAKDLLIDKMFSKSFARFTLWSQHLVLHTRDSLRRALVDAGFRNVTIESVQRYGVSNHLQWLADSKPGGHKSILSAFETPDLTQAYSAALSKIDACDTLVAIAST